MFTGSIRYILINYIKSEESKKIVEDEQNAFSLQLPNKLTTDLTLQYKVNKKKITHEFFFYDP